MAYDWFWGVESLHRNGFRAPHPPGGREWHPRGVTRLTVLVPFGFESWLCSFQGDQIIQWSYPFRMDFTGRASAGFLRIFVRTRHDRRSRALGLYI